jgi:hypothetical protein
MPPYAMHNEQGGVALAVFERAKDGGGHAQMRPVRRGENMGPADLRAAAALVRSSTALTTRQS